MSAVFPGAVFSTNTKVAGNTIQPSHINNLQDEITAIESAILSTGLAFKTVMACRAVLSSASPQTIATGAGVSGVSFTAADTFDTANMHDPSSQSSRISVPVSGYYQCSAQARWSSTQSTVGFRQLRLNVRDSTNGYPQVAISQIGPGDALSTGTCSQVVSDLCYCPSTAYYISVDVAQNSGGNVLLETATVSAVFVGN